MRKQDRATVQEPEALRSNAAAWTTAWTQKREAYEASRSLKTKATPAAKTAKTPRAIKAAPPRPPQFDWHGIRPHLKEALKPLNQEHCCFCDTYPLDDRTDEDIEHFLPCARFPAQAYHWENLFYICELCNVTKNHQTAAG
jgi:hypothetical protein